MSLSFFLVCRGRSVAVAVAACLLGSAFVASRAVAGEITPPAFDPVQRLINDTTLAVPLADGRILACRAIYGTQSSVTIVRLNADGSADPTFSTGDLNASGLGLVLPLTNGQILLELAAREPAGEDFATVLLRLNTDGSVDKSYQAAYGPSSYGIEQARLPDGKLLLTIYEEGESRLVRLNADGTLDAKFNAAVSPISQCKVAGNGDILVTSARPNGDDDEYGTTLARLGPDGTFKANFQLPDLSNPELSDFGGTYVRDFLSLEDGKVVVALAYEADFGSEPSRVFRFNVDGTRDGTFDSSVVFDGSLERIDACPAGFLIQGYFLLADQTSTYRVARLDHNGKLDGSYKSVVDGRSTMQSILATRDGGLHAILWVFNDPDGGQPGFTYEHARFDADGQLIDSRELDPAHYPSLLLAADGEDVYVVATPFSDASPIETIGGAGGVINPPAGAGGGVITRRRPAVTVSAVRSRVYAGSATPGKFIVRRGDADLSMPLRIVYRVEGSAVAGRDYCALRRVRVIPAGQHTARIAVRPVGDAFGRPEGGRANVTIRLLPRIDYREGARRKAKDKLLERADLTDPQG